jgi:hypothetical protein
MALFWALADFSVSSSYTQSAGLLWWGISPSQGLYVHRGQHKHTINAHTHIHALSVIRTDKPSVQASEDSSCRRLRGHCNRRWDIKRLKIMTHQTKPSRIVCVIFHSYEYNKLCSFKSSDLENILRPRPFPSTSLPINYSLLILSLDAHII